MAETADLSPDALGDEERRAVEHLLFRIADDEFVLAERYTEWQVRAPTLESDLALSNIAQDELGHARLWFDLLENLGYTESELIWERAPDQWHHSTMVELPWPSGGWADVVVRGYLYDVAEQLRLESLIDSSYPPIRNRIGKVRGEEDYHLEHAHSWLERLADGEGQDRLQAAIDRQFKHALTLFAPTDPKVESTIDELGLRTDSLPELGEEWLNQIVPFLESLGLNMPLGDQTTVTDEAFPPVVGRDGEHTDDWQNLYDEFTRTYDQVDIGDPVKIMDDPDDG